MTKSGQGSRRAVVTRDYRAQYGDPIRLRDGDVVRLGKRDVDYPGWIWCTHADGRVGWVPETFLAIVGIEGKALCEYSAQELTVTAGETLELGETYARWANATNARGERGWLPIDHLAIDGDNSGLELDSSPTRPN